MASRAPTEGRAMALWPTASVLIVTILALAREWLSPAATLMAALVTLMVAGVVDPDQALAGFSNAAPITVAALYVITRAAQRSGLLAPVVASVVGVGEGDRGPLFRLLGLTTLASAFFNNTPVVAALLPQVESWADGHGRSPSTYLMPLSFAAILGGLLTLMGTSTNVVVSGLLSRAGEAPLGFFEISQIGGFVAVGGLALLVTLSPVLLPTRSVMRELGARTREFVVELSVERDGPLDGVSVRDAGLRHLQGVFLAQVQRPDEIVSPARPTTVLHGGDHLRFVGQAGRIFDLRALPGLRLVEQQTSKGISDPAVDAMFKSGPWGDTADGVVEAVIGAASPLVGRTVRESGFRGRYQAAVVAIQRAGQRVDAKLGDVRLQVGDALVLLADPGFVDRWRDREDFLLVAPLRPEAPPAKGRRVPVAVVLAAVVGLTVAGVLPLVSAALLGAVAVVVFRLLSAGEARRAVDLDVVVMIAAGFGLAEAVRSSGLADLIARAIVGFFGPFGPRAALFGVTLGTALLTEVVTNTAAALLVFPIARATALSFSLATRPFAIAVAATASASFLPPVGYQTNTMVYGPGGYRYTDYLRLGLPLTLLVLVLVTAIVPLFWPLSPP